MTDVSVSINGERITRVFETKFLGVITQSNLKWNIHIIANITSKTIGVINNIKTILTTAHLKLLYQSLIQPYLNYCCIVWASPVKSCVLETILKNQKRSVGSIMHASYRAHSKPLLQKLNTLTIYDIYLSQLLQFLYKSINHLLPSFINYFTRTKDIHIHDTRGHNNKLRVITAQKPSPSIFKASLIEYLLNKV